MDKPPSLEGVPATWERHGAGGGGCWGREWAVSLELGNAIPRGQGLGIGVPDTLAPLTFQPHLGSPLVPPPHEGIDLSTLLAQGHTPHSLLSSRSPGPPIPRSAGDVSCHLPPRRGKQN